MFSGCNTLAELNVRRNELLANKVSVLEVNAAYNAARKELTSSRPQFKKPVTFTAEPRDVKMYTPGNIQLDAPPNVIIVESGCTHI